MGCQENYEIAGPSSSGCFSTNLVAAVMVALALAFCVPLSLAQEMAQGPAPRLAEDPHTDSHIAEAIRQVSAEHILSLIHI